MRKIAVACAGGMFFELATSLKETNPQPYRAASRLHTRHGAYNDNELMSLRLSAVVVLHAECSTFMAAIAALVVETRCQHCRCRCCTRRDREAKFKSGIPRRGSGHTPGLAAALHCAAFDWGSGPLRFCWGLTSLGGTVGCVFWFCAPCGRV